MTLAEHHGLRIANIGSYCVGDFVSGDEVHIEAPKMSVAKWLEGYQEI